VTETSPPVFRPAKALVGALVGFFSHALVFGAAYVAGRLGGPGMESLGAIVGTLLLGEAVLGLVCLITGAILFRRGHRELGLGLLGGWIVGLISAYLLIQR
jgi:hypothetical protein